MKDPDFIAIPYQVFIDDISHAAKLVYGRLKLYAGAKGVCFAKHKTIASEVRLKERQLRTVLKELQHRGWIDWIKARTSCVYTIHPERQKTATVKPVAANEIGRKPPDGAAINCQSDRQNTATLDRQKTADRKEELKRGIEKRNLKSSSASVSGFEQHTLGAPSAPASASSASLDLVLNASTSRLPADELQKPQSAARPKGVGAPKTDNPSQNQKAEPTAGAIGVCLTSEERFFHEGKARKPFWTEEDQILIWNALYAYMERDPPEALVQSCELRAAGATAQQVLDLLKRKHSNPRYRCGRKYGPGGKGGNSYDNPWNWFLTVIGNEFQGQHFPEPKAKIDSALSREQFDEMTAALE